MKCRLIIQENADTGERNLFFTQDPITAVEDMLIPWDNTRIMIEEVLLFASNEAIEGLLELDFRSEPTCRNHTHALQCRGA